MTKQLHDTVRALGFSTFDYFLRWQIKRFPDFRSRSIIVSSSPRGGSTWLSEILTSARGYLTVWEPLEPSSHQATLELGFGWDYRIRPDETIDAAHRDYPKFEYLRNLFEGTGIDHNWIFHRGLWSLIRETGYSSDLWLFRGFVYKFIRGNLLLAWMLRTFSLKGVLLVRHPCAVVASQLQYAWHDPLVWKLRWKDLLEDSAPGWLDVMFALSEPEEVLAFDWCVTNLFPLKERDPDRVWLGRTKTC